MIMHPREGQVMAGQDMTRRRDLCGEEDRGVGVGREKWKEGMREEGEKGEERREE